MAKSTKLNYAAFKRFMANKSHYILLIVLMLFVAAAIVLGEWLGFYDKIWWWDDMLHGAFGTLMGLVGLLGIYLFNSRHTMAISPFFVALFVLCFAMALSVLWEIYEFIVDILFMSSMQPWNLPDSTPMIGKPYQGTGLRDTMSDLIVAYIGAIVAAIFSFFVYKHEKRTVLSVMRQTFPWLRRTHNKR